MDAFFAAIEQKDNPALRGKPVVVGGDPFGRGVVSTASYEARKFGIHSAMPSAHARRLCPDAVFLRPRFRRYQEASSAIMAILRQHTGLMEPASLDEAYLDVTRHRFGIDDPVMVATMIKQNIFAVTGLTASAGVAPNLFLAKVASDFKKPDGLTVVRPQEVENFLRELPVRKIPGVGPVTEEALQKLKFLTCGDLAAADLRVLIKHFGKTGVFLQERARGLDEREVEPEWEPKQSSSEETFDQDTKDKNFLKDRLRDYSREVFAGLSESGRMGKTVVLKVKYFDFEQITRSHTLKREPRDWQEIYGVACDLLEKKTLAGKKPVRLIGLGLSGLKEITAKPLELDLFGEKTA